MGGDEVGPENVFLCAAAGQSPVLKLTDLRLSKLVDEIYMAGLGLPL